MAQQPVSDTVYVVFSSEVTPQSSATLLATMTDCANKRVKTVYFALSTLGGDVAHGIAIYNTLRGLPFKLITHMWGMSILSVT